MLTQEKLIQLCNDDSVAVTAYSPLGRGSLLKDVKIKSIAEKHGKTPAQVLIRYQIERGVIVIPKSVNSTRIKENFNVFDFQLSFDDLKQINSLNNNTRISDVAYAKNHKYYPFNEPF